MVRKGSMKTSLNPLAINIAKICRQNKIDLAVKWIRCMENTKADKLSRFVDLDDWGVKAEFVAMLQEKWLRCQVDRFASAANKKLPRFNSKFVEENSEGIDAFAQNWTGNVSWIVPPPHLIPKVVKHLKNSRAKGNMVFPKWPSAKFWPFLFIRMGPIPEIKKQKTVQNRASILVAGKHEKSIFTPSQFKSPMMAVLLDASEA